MIEIIILLVVSWLLMGFCGCVYWWTKDNDFTLYDIILALFVSISGPFSFVVGWITHGSFSKIIIRKKG